VSGVISLIIIVLIIVDATLMTLKQANSNGVCTLCSLFGLLFQLGLLLTLWIASLSRGLPGPS